MGRIEPWLGAALGVVALASAPTAHAQQRQFFNGGFELNDPRGPGTPTFQIYNNADVDEWTDQTGFIELWDSTFNGVASYEGDVHAEMNANAPGTLYQTVCLVAGETIGWSFAHRARSGGPSTQTALLEIAELNGGPAFQSLASQSSTVPQGWNVNTGSVVYSGTTGNKRVQFRTTDPGSFGNFVDALRLDISSFAEMASGSSQDVEDSGANLPVLLVNGEVEVATTVPVSVIGGSADSADFTLDATQIVIPVGIYNDVAFPMPVTINADNDPEPDETIIFELGTPSTGEVLFASKQCDGSAPILQATYTISNDDTRLVAAKSVATWNPGGGPEPLNTPGSEVLYTIRTENVGPVAIAAGGIFLFDALPAELELFTGDVDGGGPASGPVLFVDESSGLTLGPGDIGFSNSNVPPTGMSDCTDPAGALYNAAVRYLCFEPQGSFAAGNPDPAFEVRFRMRIP